MASSYSADRLARDGKLEVSNERYVRRKSALSGNVGQTFTAKINTDSGVAVHSAKSKYNMFSNRKGTTTSWIGDAENFREEIKGKFKQPQKKNAAEPASSGNFFSSCIYYC
jgi:hypothetical protein